MNLVFAEPEQSQRLQHRRVNLFSDNDCDRRRSCESLFFHIPTDVAKDPESSGSKCGYIRHLRAGDKSSTASGRKAEEFQEPGEDDVLEICGNRRKIEETGVLVPRGSQPLGRDSNGKSATNDPSEETSPRTGYRCWRTDF